MDLDWGNIAGSAVKGYGYSELYDDLRKQQQQTTSDFNNIAGGLRDETQFTPWGVTSAYGGAKATEDGMNYALSKSGADWTKGLQGNAFMEMLKANQGVGATQNSLFSQMQAAMAPENQRAQGLMNQQLLNSGRSGMTSQAYGGTPEQLAYAKALQEQQASNWLQAGTVARGDVMDAYTRGLGYLGASYDPTKMLMAQGEQGLNFQGKNQTMQQQLAGMLAQLGIAKSNNDVNYGNIKAGAFGDMINAGSDLISGYPQADGTTGGGLWDTISGVGSDIWEYIKNG
jgi:hypothetical protein